MRRARGTSSSIQSSDDESDYVDRQEPLQQEEDAGFDTGLGGFFDRVNQHDAQEAESGFNRVRTRSEDNTLIDDFSFAPASQEQPSDAFDLLLGSQFDFDDDVLFEKEDSERGNRFSESFNIPDDLSIPLSDVVPLAAPTPTRSTNYFEDGGNTSEEDNIDSAEEEPHTRGRTLWGVVGAAAVATGLVGHKVVKALTDDDDDDGGAADTGDDNVMGREAAEGGQQNVVQGGGEQGAANDFGASTTGGEYVSQPVAPPPDSAGAAFYGGDGGVSSSATGAVPPDAGAVFFGPGGESTGAAATQDGGAVLFMPGGETGAGVPPDAGAAFFMTGGESGAGAGATSSGVVVPPPITGGAGAVPPPPLAE